MQWVEVQSKLQQAQSAYELSKKNVADCRLVAPVSGIVGQKFVDAGETAMPGSPVVTLLDISHVKVKVSVPENEINGIPTSVASTIKVAALGGETFQGGRIVKHVASDAMTHSYGIQIHLANPSGRLLPGMVCTVRFNHECNPQITVPVTAVQRGQGQSLYVWTISNGRVRQQPVSTGETYGSRIVITDGLKERDSVVTAGWQKLSNGSKVSAL
jgi:RND family efflux transporter MFP subunit